MVCSLNFDAAIFTSSSVTDCDVGLYSSGTMMEEYLSASSASLRISAIFLFLSVGNLFLSSAIFLTKTVLATCFGSRFLNNSVNEPNKVPGKASSNDIPPKNDVRPAGFS